MTQEEKELLLKDLSSRLPYGVKVWYKYYPDNVTEKFATSIRLVDGKIALSSKFNKEGDWYPIEEAGEILIKPYLRPMSSMTDDELVDYKLLEKQCEILPTFAYISVSKCVIFDWLNKNMFDYRGLIPKGLAIEVTEENNPYKENNKI